MNSKSSKSSFAYSTPHSSVHSTPSYKFDSHPNQPRF